MKKFSGRQALLLAFAISTVSLCTALSSAVFVRAITKKSPIRETRNANNQTIAEGRRIFVRHCVECHGFDARGEAGPDLHNLRAGNRLIRQIITSGIKEEMPAYSKALDEAEVQALIAYLKTLRS